MKPSCLKKGDKVAIVSLSSGVLGESFVRHELDIAIARLNAYGLKPVFMQNALKGIDYIKAHPEARAADLKEAFCNDDIKGIICAIGGVDGYKVIPYLLEDEDFCQAVKDNPKLFTGFSDTTVHHLMLNKLGLNTFYGPNIVCDLAELDRDMLPFTKEWFEVYLGQEKTNLTSSDIWYYERTDFSPAAVGTPRKSEKETKGFEVLQGSGKVKGKLFGGCIDSIYELAFSEERKNICDKYKLLPQGNEWQDKILFIETSDSKPTPELFEEMLRGLGKLGAFDYAQGMLVGKPQDAVYYEEYKQVIEKVLGDKTLPVMYNLNFGHSLPRCVVPYNITCEVDFDNKVIIYLDKLFED